MLKNSSPSHSARENDKKPISVDKHDLSDKRDSQQVPKHEAAGFRIIVTHEKNESKKNELR